MTSADSAGAAGSQPRPTATPADVVSHAVDDVFRQFTPDARATDVAATQAFRRYGVALDFGGQALLDSFADHPGVACAFVRLAPGPARHMRLVFDGIDAATECAAGGWLLTQRRPSVRTATRYWLPQPPALRTLDANGRILTQCNLPLDSIGGDGARLWVDVPVDADAHLDLPVWRFAPDAVAKGVLAPLEDPLPLERQRWFLRSSHAALDRLADVYACLVHGRVYDNRFVRRARYPARTWRICSENEAHSLYMALNGLERATGRALYTLLKRQIVGSIIARQAADGGWHHGEWTDLMESHFRLHTAGLLVLEAALEEAPDPAVRQALDAAAAFLAGRTDRTDIGTWFLHDALEESAERASADGAPPWEPTKILGASPTNKLILNTHLDSLVALDRYRELAHDDRHAGTVESAHGAALAVLRARPAEWLYRPAYRALWLTLLPSERAARLPLPARLVRRLVPKLLAPNLYRLKWRHPRLVMPGGLIDRHLAPKHYNTIYHTVNLMDVVRLTRRFPHPDLHRIVHDAVAAVTRTGLLEFWVQRKLKQPIGYWVEAIYQLCTLDPAPELRAHLAQAMLAAEDLGLGLPPTLLGADPEVIPHTQQVTCPCPADARLRVANLGRRGHAEIVVINPCHEPVALAWEGAAPGDLAWCAPSAPRAAATKPAPTMVPARGWVWGVGKLEQPALR